MNSKDLLDDGKVGDAIIAQMRLNPGAISFVNGITYQISFGAGTYRLIDRRYWATKETMVDKWAHRTLMLLLLPVLGPFYWAKNISYILKEKDAFTSSGAYYYEVFRFTRKQGKEITPIFDEIKKNHKLQCLTEAEKNTIQERERVLKGFGYK